MDGARQLFELYREFSSYCVSAGLKPPSPEEWTERLEEEIRLSLSGARDPERVSVLDSLKRR